MRRGIPGLRGESTAKGCCNSGLMPLQIRPHAPVHVCRVVWRAGYQNSELLQPWREDELKPADCPQILRKIPGCMVTHECAPVCPMALVQSWFQNHLRDDTCCHVMVHLQCSPSSQVFHPPHLRRVRLKLRQKGGRSVPPCPIAALKQKYLTASPQTSVGTLHRSDLCRDLTTKQDVCAQTPAMTQEEPPLGHVKCPLQSVHTRFRLLSNR